MGTQSKQCVIHGRIMTKVSSINELTLRYKIKGEQSDSHFLFDRKTHAFCHIISDLITDSRIMDEGQSDVIKDNINIQIPRRVVFVLDRSGSMKGTKWDQTVSSSITALKQLKSFDRVNVMLFDHDIELLWVSSFAPCVPRTMDSVIRSLQDKEVRGATNINNALLKAIELIKSDSNEGSFFVNQIILLTDGEPNDGICDTHEIVRNIRNANDSQKISIFCFGIGNDSNTSAWIHDLNHSLLKLLSVHNHGFYKRIKQSMTDASLTTYFNILSTPILSNINIRYLNKNVNHLTATQFNVLYSGNDLIVCGRMENMDNDDCIQLDVIVSALTGLGKEEESTWKRIANSKAVKPMRISKRIKIQHNEVNPDANVERIWAYLKLQQFANNRLIHNDMIAMEEDEKQSEQCDALSLAIKHQFVTPWTSMILVQIKEDIALDHTQMDIHPKPISLSTPDAQYGTDAHNDETIPESFSEEREKERLIQCIQELNTISAIDRFLRTHDVLSREEAVIEAVISSNFEDKLKLLTDPLLTNPDGLPPRKAIIGTIHHQFDQLTDSQHVSLKQASEDIIQTKECVEVLNMLLSRISIHVRQPFSYSSQSTEMSPGHALDHDRIEYIFSDNGKAFMALLVSLHTYAEFHRLAVCAHLNCFGEWWRSKMRFIATGVEVISTVNTLLSNDYSKINELYSRMGFIATDYQRDAMQNIENYKQIKDKKSMISKLMQHFVPKSIFYGKEIKEMAALEADLEAKLRTMNCTELKSIFNTDISIYNNNAELFHMIRQIA
eukprot:430318_1